MLKISKEYKKIAFLLLGLIIVYWSFQEYEMILTGLSEIIDILMPLIIGLSFAFILNIPMKWIELHWRKQLCNTSSFFYRHTRGISLTATVLLLLSVVGLVLFIVIPELMRTASLIKDRLPEYIIHLQNVWSDFSLILAKWYPDILSIHIDWNAIASMLYDVIGSGGVDLLQSTYFFAFSVFSLILDFFLGFIFAIYFLLSKEKVLLQIRKLAKAYLQKSTYQRLHKLFFLSSDIFERFISGQLFEAFIVGVLCFVGMVILRFPYALMISVIIGITALIPIFGALFGTAIGFILICMVDPMQAVWFTVFILVMQQIEGDLIYPRMIGNTIGLPSIWVFTVVTLSGSCFGIIGMILSVPISSILYTLLKEDIRLRYKNNKISNIDDNI